MIDTPTPDNLMKVLLDLVNVLADKQRILLEEHKKLKDNQRMMTKAIFDLHKRVEKSENKNSIIISGR